MSEGFEMMLLFCGTFFSITVLIVGSFFYYTNLKDVRIVQMMKANVPPVEAACALTRSDSVCMPIMRRLP